MPDKVVCAVQTISRRAAEDLLAAAIEHAEALQAEVAIAVVDRSGLLKAFTRTDNAAFLSIDVAIDKAWTAASFGISTQAWVDLLGKHQHIAQLAHRPHFVAVTGGYPLFYQDRLIGGIGVSGGRNQQDQQIAEAALNASGFAVPRPGGGPDPLPAH